MRKAQGVYINTLLEVYLPYGPSFPSVSWLAYWLARRSVSHDFIKKAIKFKFHFHASSEHLLQVGENFLVLILPNL